MAIATPDWLTTRSGELKASANGQSWSVHLGGKLWYVLTLEPANGKFSCRVMETINGKRLDKGTIWPSADDAVRGGLDELRSAVGW